MSTSGDFETDLAAALAASIEDHQQEHSTLVLDSRFVTRRADIVRSDAALVKCLAGEPRNGQLTQLNLFDQFHPVFNDLIEEHSTPSSICGYVACALAKQLARRLAGSPCSYTSAVDAMAAAEALRDGIALKPQLADVMAYIRASRERWIAEHPADFPNDQSRRDYLTAWVANYEISDYLACQTAKDVDGVVFLRFNQWPERGSATHEEAERLLEEVRFGGGQGDKADTVTYSEAEPGTYSMFVVEDFGADRLKSPDYRDGDALERPVLRTPAEWKYAQQAREQLWHPKVFVLDLNGHFCVAVPHEDSKSLPGGLDCCLMLLNTTQASYLGGSGGLIASVAFDLAFPPLG